MANVLYIDDDPMALKALQGMFDRSRHTLNNVQSTDEAWKELSQNVDYDLLMLELKLKNENAWSIIKRVRSNTFLTSLPILIYTNMKDRRAMRSIVELNVQNYLFKPYREPALMEELDRSEQEDWRLRLAGNPDLFSSRLTVQVDDFYQKNQSLLEQLEKEVESLLSVRYVKGIADREGELKGLAKLAEKMDYTVLQQELLRVIELANQQKAQKMRAVIEMLPHAIPLQRYRLKCIQQAIEESHKKSENESEEETEEMNQTAESGQVDTRKSKYTPEQVEEHISNMQTYPVVESVAAAFQMIANDAEINLEDVVEMIQKDSGLATAVLQFSNSPAVAPASPVEDIHQAISVLGLERVRLLATTLRTVPEMSELFKPYRWQEFWAHQVGCALLSEYIFSEIDLPGRAEQAYLAGLLCEIGKILLADLDCELYKKVLADTRGKSARGKSQSVVYAEQTYFGCSHNYAGLIFAKVNNLPEMLQATIAYKNHHHVESGYLEYIGCVSLASYLSLSHEVGNGGDVPDPKVPSSVKHFAWDFFSPWLYPAFNKARAMRKFENKAQTLRKELLGIVDQHFS